MKYGIERCEEARWWEIGEALGVRPWALGKGRIRFVELKRRWASWIGFVLFVGMFVLALAGMAAAVCWEGFGCSGDAAEPQNIEQGI